MHNRSVNKDTDLKSFSEHEFLGFVRELLVMNSSSETMPVELNLSDWFDLIYEETIIKQKKNTLKQDHN